MNPEEINKKIEELLHSRLNLINGELLSSEELQKEVKGAAKEITDKVFEEISALPTIKGWVARGMDCVLYFSTEYPIDGADNAIPIPSTMFTSLKRWGEPIEVELPIIRK